MVKLILFYLSAIIRFSPFALLCPAKLYAKPGSSRQSREYRRVGERELYGTPLKIRSCIFFFLLIISSLHAAEIIPEMMSEIVVDKPGSYCFKRVNLTDIALVHTDPRSAVQTTRLLPPTLFPLTSIIQSGSATNQDIIQNLVTIVANDVIFNINGFNLTQGLVIRGNNVTVKNGLIDPTAVSPSASLGIGVNVAAGSSNVILDSLTVRNAAGGIILTGVSGGVVSNCEVLLSSTGLSARQSTNVIFERCTAMQCSQVGFAMLASTTNICRDCTALATGYGNTTVTNNNVHGFIATNGYGNVFERCIANATQALSTTDPFPNSLVSGITLDRFEQATKIIGCESSNTLTSPNGVTIPFGILLSARLSGLTTVTIWNPGGNPSPASNIVYSVAWSPDGIYLATGGVVNSNQNNIQLYTFNYTTTAQFLTQIVSITPASTSLGVFTVAWSPDGNYLAVGGQDNSGGVLYLYGFDRDNQTLSQLQLIKGSGISVSVNQVAWSADGKYLAAGTNEPNSLNIYQFDEVAQNLTLVAFVSPSLTVDSVAWSPDDNYLAVGAVINNGAALYLYSFSRATQTLTLIGSLNPDGGGSTNIETVAWSPDGQYLAVGGILNTNAVVIYSFNPNNLSVLTLLTAISIGGANGPFGLTWSPDGTYLVVGGTFTASNALFLYLFNRGSNQLVLQQSINPYVGTQNFINSVAWSPDGQYLAIGESLTNISNAVLFINKVLTFPSANVITNNTVYGNTGGLFPSGVGISGSSIANLIIQNTSYSNPVQLGVNMPFVPTNYAFVQNVFNQNFGDAPTGLQNIAMGDEQVVRTPPNIGLLAQQLSFDVFTTMQSEIAFLSLLLSSTTTLGVNCLATQITTGTTSTTITAAGIYCLGTNMANQIVINSSNVQLNLNNLSANSGIQVGAGFDQVTIFNGTVSSVTDGGITVTLGATNLTLSQVRAHDCIIGFNLANVTNARIAFCDLFSNNTGISLTNCVNVSLDKCVARSNLITGFSLLNSSTNVLRDCEALSTGDLSTAARQNIFGFVSNSGAGNVFERCIANSTQGLTVTAADSVVAGFALRGSEQYSKIIACESSNATTSSTGVTIPYGIWLESQFSGLVTVTSINAGGSSVIAYSAKWSRDGVYLAVLPTGTTNTFIIYKFDYLRKGLVQVATATQSAPIATVNPASLIWSPDGNYLIATELTYPGSDNGIFLYRFDKLGQSVQEVTSVNTGVAEPIIADWSPDGKYVAVAIDPLTGLQVVMLVYQFDEVNQTLTQVATLPSSQVPASAAGLSVAWSPDGNYVALGLGVSPTTNDFYLYRFDRPTQTLIQVDVHSIDPGSNGTNIYSLAWSFDGQYIAVGSGSGDGSFDVNIFQFNRTTQTLSFVVGLPVGSASGNQPVFGLSWSPDGKYLAFGGNIYTTGNTLYVYQFNRGSNSLSQVAAVNPDGGSVSDVVYDVQWSPDGQYLAIAGQIKGNTNNAVFIYQALTFPKANVVMDNTVYCNSGASFPSGVGIAGSSIANMIIQNNAYSNPVNKNSQNPLVPSNYIFVTNVFNPIFQNRPTLIQNIGIGDAQVVPQPQDTVLLAKQVAGQITQLGLCSPTVILAPTSITASGGYCLGQDVTGDIIVTSTYVVLDLNKRTIYGHVAFLNSGESLITNGFIRPPDPTVTGTQALLIGSNCVHVTATNLFIDCTLSNTTNNAFQGQDGITVVGIDTQIKGCTIKAGSATAATTAGAGVRGGYGINLIAPALRTVIQDCVVLQTGNGGAANGAANAGGDAGHGIRVASGVITTKISNCLVMSTGVGGAGGSSASGGRGGDAVRVESGAQNTEVRNSRMRNTGTGGSGSTLGVPGKAVFDLVTTPTTLSSIFTNFAFSIANPTKFDIQAATIAGGPNVGVLTPNPPTSNVLNLFANVFSS